VARVRVRERRHTGPTTEIPEERRAREAPAGVEGILFDPIGEERFSQALVQAMATRRRMQRGGDQLLALPLPPLKLLLEQASPLPRPALLRTDQTHTSVVFGDRLFLKVYRRIESGIQPELELSRVLVENTSFRNIPLMAGSLELRPERSDPLTLAVLAAFIPNQGDAWRYTAHALGRYYEQVLTRPGGAGEAPSLQTNTDPLDSELPPLAQELVGGTLDDARLLGRRIAEFHVALASVTDDPAFAPEPFTSLYQRSLYQSLRSQTRKTFELLRKRRKELPEAAREDAQHLLERENEILEVARRIYEVKITAQQTRSHGDLHLGQILVTGKDVFLIDLEGDARRSLSDRRRKRSPLRDVASMVRSFHYAAFLALEHGHIRPEDARTSRPWGFAWRYWVSTTFIRAYLEVAGSASFLPQDRGQLRLLLEYYLLRRAAQELRSELLADLNRVRIPVEGLLQFLDWHKQPGSAAKGERGASAP
jgi:maltose alpha-D-glucosyltransferase/alpha-amylase